MRRAFAFFSYKTKDAATGVSVAASSGGKHSNTLARKSADAAVGAPQAFGFSRYAQTLDKPPVLSRSSADAGVGVVSSKESARRGKVQRRADGVRSQPNRK